MNKMDAATQKVAPHSVGWIAQTWISFGLALAGAIAGIVYIPADGWVKGFLGISALLLVSSTLNVAKTMRDMHEAKRLSSRVDEARVEQFLAKQNPLDGVD